MKRCVKFNNKSMYFPNINSCVHDYVHIHVKRSMRGVDGACCCQRMTLKNNQHFFEYAFGEGGGGHQKAYAVYAFINVDNCERPLS